VNDVGRYFRRSLLDTVPGQSQMFELNVDVFLAMTRKNCWAQSIVHLAQQ
jgi:hypothetical protein